MTEEDAGVNIGLFEPIGYQLVLSKQEPGLASLAGAVNVLEYLEDILLVAGSWNMKSPWNVHENFPLNGCVRVSKHKVELPGFPFVQQHKDQIRANVGPSNDRRIGIRIIIDIFSLAMTANVQADIPLVNLLCLDLSLATHLPDSRQYRCSLWY